MSDPNDLPLRDREALATAAAHFREGRIDDAVCLARELAARQPGSGVANKLLGSALHAQGRHAEAVEVLRRAARQLPWDAQTLTNLGNALAAAGQSDEAIAVHRAAIGLLPDAATPRYNLGCALLAQGRREEALDALWQAYERAPADADTARLCRELLIELGDEAGLQRFCRLNLLHLPDDATAMAMLGALLLKDTAGDPGEAEGLLRAALLRMPDDAATWSNLGVALQAAGRAGDAVEAGQRAVALAPDWAQGHSNLAVALRDAGAWEESKAHCLRALSLDGECADAYYNLGCVCADLGEHALAREACIEAVKRAPRADWLLQGAHACRQLLDWDGAELLEGELFRLLAEGALPTGAAALPPFAFLTTPGTDAAAQLAVARQFAARFAARPAQALPASAEDGGAADRPLRIGLLSADFRDHATAYLLTGVLEALDPAAFRLVAYDHGPATDDAYRRRLQAAIPAWVDLAGLSDFEAAQRMRADGIDIAIDLKGWTQGFRAGILAHRPAPVQMQWLGFPGTMGAPWLDYVIADAVTIPPGAEDGYSEKILRLPGCYQPNDNRREIAAPPPRAALGLPDAAVVLAAFHQHYKITRPTFELWLNVLRQVPDAVLWLLDASQEARAVLEGGAVATGVDPARLIWAPRLPVAEHLGRLAAADLALDVFPVNAHTTASDALWAGVPQVARCGETFVSRVSASILNAVGLPELVACDDAAYEALALGLARDAARRDALRVHLRAARDSALLFDSAAFARHLGAGLEAAWARYRQGLPAADIDVAG